MEDNEQDKESPIHIELEIVPKSIKKSSPRREDIQTSALASTLAPAPAPAPALTPIISIALKFTIIKDGSSAADYESVKLNDLISQKELTKMKKEYKYTQFKDLYFVKRHLFTELKLHPEIIRNAENTEKCIGYIEISKLIQLIDIILLTFTDFISFIIDIINNKVQKHLNIHLSLVKIEDDNITNEVIDQDAAKITLFNESLANIYTPNEEDLRRTMQTSTKNSWTLFINSHSDFIFYYPENFKTTDPILTSIFYHIIHLLYYGEIGLYNLHIIADNTNKELYEADFMFIIIQYLYKIKNFKLTDTRILNQLIIDNKVDLIRTFNKEKEIYIKYRELDEEKFATNKKSIQIEEDRLEVFIKLQTTSPESSTHLDSFILKSQTIISTLLSENIKLQKSIDTRNSYNEIYELYLHKLENDDPFFNIITLGLNSYWPNLISRLYKNSKIVIIKNFQFDNLFNNFKIMNIKSTNPKLNELNELDLRDEEDKVTFLDILIQIPIEPSNIAKITTLLSGNNITMAQVAYIGQLLGLQETNIISNGCNDYKPETKHLTPELISYIHDDPNGLAFGLKNKKKYAKKNKTKKNKTKITKNTKNRKSKRNNKRKTKKTTNTTKTINKGKNSNAKNKT